MEDPGHHKMRQMAFFALAFFETVAFVSGPDPSLGRRFHLESLGDVWVLFPRLARVSMCHRAIE